MEILTKNSESVPATFEGSKAFINEMLTWFSGVWAWSDSSITESEGVLTGKFYFKENVYVQIKTDNTTSSYKYTQLRISFHTPNIEIENFNLIGYSGSVNYWQFSVAKGVSGFALAITCSGYAPQTAKATNFTMFFGKCVSTNNEEKYGAVLFGDNTGRFRRIGDEDGKIPDGVYTISSNNSASYKAALFPICNPVTGSVFKNIYEPKFCSFNYIQFMLGSHVFQAGASSNDPCLSDE